MMVGRRAPALIAGAAGQPPEAGLKFLVFTVGGVLEKLVEVVKSHETRA